MTKMNKEKSRVDYYDAVKGFAILLVVFAHAIAWQFQDYNEVLTGDNKEVMIIWRIIYSFHMPLFIFCSGLFHDKENGFYTFKNSLNLIWRRFQTLIIPYIIMGSIYNMVSGSFRFYWFLLTLFEFIVITTICSFLFSRTTKYPNLKYWFYAILILVCPFFIPQLMSFERFPYIDIHHFALFPYFLMGVLCHRFRVIERLCSEKYQRYSLTIASVLMILLIWVFIIKDLQLPLMGLVGYILPISAFIAVFAFFSYALDKTNKIYRILCNMGVHSLEIYLLHVFFRIQIPELGLFVIRNYNDMGGARSALTIQVLIAIVLTTIAISFCYLVMHLLKATPLLNKLLLGRS